MVALAAVGIANSLLVVLKLKKKKNCLVAAQVEQVEDEAEGLGVSDSPCQWLADSAQK